MYIKYIKIVAMKNLFFNFLFYNTLPAKVDGNALAEKKLSFFFNKKVSLIKNFQFPPILQN